MQGAGSAHRGGSEPYLQLEEREDKRAKLSELCKLCILCLTQRMQYISGSTGVLAPHPIRKPSGEGSAGARHRPPTGSMHAQSRAQMRGPASCSTGPHASRGLQSQGRSCEGAEAIFASLSIIFSRLASTRRFLCFGRVETRRDEALHERGGRGAGGHGR